MFGTGAASHRVTSPVPAPQHWSDHKIHSHVARNNGIHSLTSSSWIKYKLSCLKIMLDILKNLSTSTFLIKLFMLWIRNLFATILEPIHPYWCFKKYSKYSNEKCCTCSGVHHKKSNCGASLVMDKVKSIVQTASNFFFPDRLELLEF
jgi:hypothetical protein